MHGQEAIEANCSKENPSEIKGEKNLHYETEPALVQVAQKGSGTLVLGDTQNLTSQRNII